jgi:hypothetical protein
LDHGQVHISKATAEKKEKVKGIKIKKEKIGGRKVSESSPLWRDG